MLTLPKEIGDLSVSDFGSKFLYIIQYKKELFCLPSVNNLTKTRQVNLINDIK